MCVNQIFAPEKKSTGGKDGPISCRVVDISGGGVRLRCGKTVKFDMEDWLFLSVENPMEEDARLNYTCCVRRVIDGKDHYEYGCEFINLSDTEQETLLRLVMTFQQRELRARRRNGDY